MSQFLFLALNVHDGKTTREKNKEQGHLYLHLNVENIVEACIKAVTDRCFRFE